MKIRFISAIALAAFATAATAQNAADYPSRPIRVIVPFGPGGGLDITTRLIGQKLTETWGQNVVVDTRPGAATIIGTEIASRANPDGYTLLMITTTFAINPGLRAKLPYDPVKQFVPVTQLNSQPNVIVVAPSFQGKTVKDLIALAKAKPGELTFASPGAGSAPHLSAEMFQRQAGISMIHVPYKGIPPAVTDVLGGRVTMLFTTTLSATPHIKAGKLRAVALTSAKRQAGIPQTILNKLSAEVARIVHLPEVTLSFQRSGAEPVGSTAKEFAAFLRAEMRKWSKVIKDAGIKPE